MLTGTVHMGIRALDLQVSREIETPREICSVLFICIFHHSGELFIGTSHRRSIVCYIGFTNTQVWCACKTVFIAAMTVLFH